jgi:hypothetical protein
MQLRFASVAGQSYRVYSTTARDHDGDPNEGSDPQWTVADTVVGSDTETIWTDSTVLTAYRVYVVTSICP